MRRAYIVIVLAILLAAVACGDRSETGVQTASTATLVPYPTSTPISAQVVADSAPGPPSLPHDPTPTAVVPVEAESREKQAEPGPPRRSAAEAPNVDMDTRVLGYWSDETASVEVLATLHNWDRIGVEGSLSASVVCTLRGRPRWNCGDPMAFTPAPGGGPVESSFVVRVPGGDVSLELHFGGDAPLRHEFHVPRRIVGVRRDVWECFSDMSTADTVYRESYGVGCGGWKDSRIHKMDQAQAVKVYIEGPGGFTDEFRQVLAYLAEVMNKRFQEVGSGPQADVVAYVGAERSPARSHGAICFGDDEFGCAERVWLYEKPTGRIVVFNRWPHLGNDLPDFDSIHRNRLRSSMTYAVVTILSDMGRRADEFSLMNGEVDHRAELNPMDEALLALHGHDLVRDGMSFEDINQLIVFGDETLDREVTEPYLAAWLDLVGALENLREESTVRYRVRASSPSCPGQYGWAEYTGGNLTADHPFMSWVSLDDGVDHVYKLSAGLDSEQIWRQTADGWNTITYGEYLETLSIWEDRLSDPHFLMSAILHSADWSRATVSTSAKGLLTIEVALDSVAAPFPVEKGALKATLVLDPATQSLIEYSADWEFEDRSCGSYTVHAIEGEFGAEFVIPDEIRLRSVYLDPCETKSLGTLTGQLATGTHWARECGPGAAGDGYARDFRFSLTGWNFVRLDLFSHDEIRLDLFRLDGTEEVPVSPEASGYLVGGYGLEHEDGRLRWAHLPLGAGEYVVKAVSLNRPSLGDFTLTLFGQRTPPPPYRFKEITTGINISCGILIEGTPLCWGGSNRREAGHLVPEGKFHSISADGQVCALREDGTPECWGGFIERAEAPRDEKFKAISVGWVHTCALRLDGTPVCWGRDQGGKASPPSGENLSQISAGTDLSCGVRPDGTAVCWGGGHPGPWEVQGGPFVSISLGTDYYCGLRQDGEALCWGGEGLTICRVQPGGWGACAEIFGGDGVSQSPPEGEVFASFSTRDPNCGLRADGSPVCWSQYLGGPFPEPQDERLTTVSANTERACGLRRDGTAVCWGHNRFGEASPPSGVYAAVADPRTLPTALALISAGGIQTCALDSDGSAVCWGPNWWRGRFTGQYTAIASGGTYACALRTDGTVECRGGNPEGQASPPGGSFVAITAGWEHTCGLRPDGTVECWGYAANERLSPPADQRFQSISSGAAHNCGLLYDWTVACWGGYLDDPDLGKAASPPDGTFTTISSGEWHTCGIRPGGEVECWGMDREGQSSPPPGIFAAISAGGHHTCGLRPDGAAECWGAGSPGSDEDGFGQGTPPLSEKFLAIDSGGNHTCGIRLDGSPVCWGRDDYGQATPLQWHVGMSTE